MVQGPEGGLIMVKFDYFYGNECEQFTFYRIPKIVIKGEHFRHLSCEAKLLYGLMLDRLSLSIKYGWIDHENRAYIRYKIEDIMEDLGCGKTTCIKILGELDSKKGIGLIEKKRQGLGQADIIYVKNFSSYEVDNHSKNAGKPNECEEVQKLNFQKSNNCTTRSSEDELAEVQKLNLKKSKNCTFTSLDIEPQEVQNLNFQKFPNNTSRSSKDKLEEVRFLDSNYNNYSNNNLNYNESILQSILTMSGEVAGLKDGNKDFPDYLDKINRIKINIEYDTIMSYRDQDYADLYNGLFEIVCEILRTKPESLRIEGKDYSYDQVEERYLKLNSTHFEYIINQMKQVTCKIYNIKNYMISALFNAPSTIAFYYQQEVQHDMYGGGWQ